MHLCDKKDVNWNNMIQTLSSLKRTTERNYGINRTDQRRK